MRIVIALVVLLRELHHGVGTAGRGIAVVTEQARPSKSRFARQYLDAVAAKSLLNALTIENDRFGRACAEGGGQDAGREMCVAHARD